MSVDRITDLRVGETAGVAPRVVLHVVESWGAGTEAAVCDYMRSADQWEHHLLVWHGDAYQIESHGESLPASVTELPSGHLARVRAVAACVRSIDPDVVHAHSSYAGIYARIAPGVTRDRVVFTPHGYSFERRDVGRLVRFAFRAAEWLLARRTAEVAAASPREAELARSLRHAAPATWVPHVLHTTPSPMRRRGKGAPVIAAMGRISAQKQPSVFAAAARCAQERGLDLRWRWIGGGDEEPTRELLAAGVEVTGWLPHERAVEMLQHSDVYVHCAQWESFPITLLEAAGAGVPVVAWRIAALEALGCRPLVDSVPELVDTVARLSAESGESEFTSYLRRVCTQANQREALDEIYGRVARIASPALAGAGR